MTNSVIPLESLPDRVSEACAELGDGLSDLLGSTLFSLWVYGAVTSADRPRRLGDVDTHAVIAADLPGSAWDQIDALSKETEGRHGIEWDSWYLLEEDMGRTPPPFHARHKHFADRAWALHRAHWHAGQFVLLLSQNPCAMVVEPTWAEIRAALDSELAFMRSLVVDRDLCQDPARGAYVIWSGCRILATLASGNAVMSKREGVRWVVQQAANHPATAWRPAIEAAGRVYDDRPRQEDGSTLAQADPSLAAAVEEALASPAGGPGDG